MSTLNSHTRKDQIAIRIPTDEYAVEFFKIISKKLSNSYIFKSQISGNLLTFNGSILRFVWNGWNVFNSISKGEIEFTEENGHSFIRHKIYFTESLFIALLFNLIPFFEFRYEPGYSLLIFVGIWILYAINYFVTVFRFNSYISEMLIKVNLEHGVKFNPDVPALG